MHRLLPVKLPVFCGGTSVEKAEHTQKGRDAGKARLQCYLSNCEIGIQKQSSGMGDAPLVQVPVKGGSRILMKQSGKVIFTEACHCSDFFQGQRFFEMFTDIIGNPKEFLHVFLWVILSF